MAYKRITNNKNGMPEPGLEAAREGRGFCRKVNAKTAINALTVLTDAGFLLPIADGKRYIDYVGSWGPMILGHAHPAVLEAVREAAARGTSYGAPCEAEVALAERVVRLVPSVEKVRFVSSGTEATMSALRVARGFTGRRKILKFDGCYHGHADMLLVAAGSGVATLGIPGSPGVPAPAARDNG